MEKRMNTARTCEEYVIEELHGLKEEYEALDMEYEELVLDYRGLAEKCEELIRHINLKGEGTEAERYELDAWKGIGNPECYELVKSMKEGLLDGEK